MLVLFLSAHFHYDNKSIYALYGVFTSLTFLMPTLSGYFADRYFNHFESILIGIVLLLIGNLLLIIFTMDTVFLGLTLTILGIGFIKPNNPTLIGFLYSPSDKRKDGGFTLFYMGMNLGGILGPIIYGFLSIKFGWRYGFCVGLFGLSCVLMLCIYQFPLLKKIELAGKNLPQQKNVNWYYLSTALIALTGLIYILLTHTKFFTIFLIIIGLIIASILYRILIKQSTSSYKNMLFLLMLNLFSIFYFACQNQINSSLLLFVNTYLLSHHLSHTLPAGIFSALEPLFVIVTAPIFAKVWQLVLNILSEKDLILLRVFLSLVFALLSFILFYSATDHSLSSFGMFLLLIIAGNLFLGMGELFIGPALMSVVAHFIDKNYQGTFMGIWSLSIAFSGFVGGLIAQISANEAIPYSAVYTPYLYTFKLVALIMLGATLLFLILLPWLRRLATN